MKRLLLPILMLALGPAASSWAVIPMPRQLALLTEARSHADLRAKMIAYADSFRTTDRNGAGEAKLFAGESYARDAMRDSAIVQFRDALELRGSYEELLALADALLARRTGGDVQEAIERMLGMEHPLRSSSGPHDQVLGRLGWAHFLAGRTDTAATLLAQISDQLAHEPEWRYRLGRVALELKDVRTGVEALVPNAVVARGSDREVMDLLAKAGREAGRQGAIANDVGKQVRLRDVAERTMLTGWGATRGTFPASDGFVLGGVAVPALRGGARPRCAVIVMAQEDSLPLYDSLAVSLARRGIAVMLLDPRGSGWSVGPWCPTPEAWAGDEHAMQKRVASDVRVALRALAQATRADTSRYLVVGSGSASAIAVEAATLDKRVAALLLVSPTPALVDEAAMLGRLEQVRLPMFIQQAPEDPFSVNALSDALYQAGNRQASRVVDASSAGRGVAQFRNDPELIPRFVTWLGEALPPRPAPRPTPRARPR